MALGNVTVKEAWRPRWEWGGASQLGGRHEQQDRWGVFTTPPGDGLLAVVADGLGGHRDGALGAQAVMDAAATVVRERTELLRTQPAEALALLCSDAQAAVVAASAKAHSTVVALWLHQNHVYWMHVGDSRFYHLRAGSRLARTRDHSAAQILIDLGEISEAEVANHPDQSRLYRSLGGAKLPKPDIGSGAILPDDVLVLCSDGFWEYISETELWEATRHGQLSALADVLVEQAVVRGGQQADNATLVLIRPLERSLVKRSWWRRLINRGRYEESHSH